nr:MAG TPA: hypothetical protein [Caudoviricetes sp.]
MHCGINIFKLCIDNYIFYVIIGSRNKGGQTNEGAI